MRASPVEHQGIADAINARLRRDYHDWQMRALTREEEAALLDFDYTLHTALRGRTN